MIDTATDCRHKMNETTENFLKAMADFKWPEPAPIFYRLYHDEQGLPICYSMEDLPFAYINIDLETYRTSPPNVRVIDGQLQIIQPSTVVFKLKPDTTGTPCHPKDVSVVVGMDQPNKIWSRQVNEIN
jgi:hypothetical protein